MRLDRIRNAVLTWPSSPDVHAVKGAVLIRDGPAVAWPELAIARAILHTNPRISAVAALLLADATARAARSHSLPPEFFAATLLQESAYDPRAISAAGASGIAQFMPETAAAVGVDPFDPYDAIDGAARLLGGYVAAYADRYADFYAASLAAYNAGPLAVERYGGVPPYAETQQYVALIYERWARIASYESDVGDDNTAERKKGPR
ncbi:MAG TPA: lytic transglycosylase domain-containing protein [Candidatus Elarobacter sp.]|nr:lytic transglycosylase domain-containing protein [Candidatus Elarobacter sp.]